MGKSRFKQIAEVHVIFEKDGKILLIRRFNTGYEDGKYSLIAGHVEKGESLVSSAIREALEEGGVEISVADLTLVHTMHRCAEEERLSFFFLTTNWRGELRNMEPHKCDEFRWCLPNDICDETIPYIRAGISCSMEKIPFSEFGW